MRTDLAQVKGLLVKPRESAKNPAAYRLEYLTACPAYGNNAELIEF